MPTFQQTLRYKFVGEDAEPAENKISASQLSPYETVGANNGETIVFLQNGTPRANDMNEFTESLYPARKTCAEIEDWKTTKGDH